jgi:3-phosphoshikimate 1-carboxyvinyltransferase
MYQARDINIEADFSQAAFLMVGAALNGDIGFSNMNIHSLQPDKEIIHILEKAGVKMTYKDDQVIIQKSSIDINQIDLAQMIDLGPILLMFATQSKTKTQFIHFERLVIKESNRLKNMLNILDEMDVFYENNQGVLTIGFRDKFHLIQMNSFNDHRIAMSIAVMATLAQTPTIIKNMEVINKSYPTFLHDLEKLGIQIKYLS